MGRWRAAAEAALVRVVVVATVDTAPSRTVDNRVANVCGAAQRVALPTDVAKLVVQRRRPFEQHKLLRFFLLVRQDRACMTRPRVSAKPASAASRIRSAAGNARS